jgi:hypothetical protein
VSELDQTLNESAPTGTPYYRVENGDWISTCTMLENCYGKLSKEVGKVTCSWPWVGGKWTLNSYFDYVHVLIMHYMYIQSLISWRWSIESLCVRASYNVLCTTKYKCGVCVWELRTVYDKVQVWGFCVWEVVCICMYGVTNSSAFCKMLIEGWCALNRK